MSGTELDMVLRERCALSFPAASSRASSHGPRTRRPVRLHPRQPHRTVRTLSLATDRITMNDAAASAATRRSCPAHRRHLRGLSR